MIEKTCIEDDVLRELTISDYDEVVSFINSILIMETPEFHKLKKELGSKPIAGMSLVAGRFSRKLTKNKEYQELYKKFNEKITRLEQFS